MPALTRDTTIREALTEVIGGYPGAAEVLHDIQSCTSREDFCCIVAQLYECGPRGSQLWKRAEAIEPDTLAKDILCLWTERRGWDPPLP